MKSLKLNKNEQKFYKIRNKNGLFSTGGMHPYFTKSGKTWVGIGPLKNHINCIEQTRDSSWKAGRDKPVETLVVYEDCDIVEFDIVVKENCKVSVSDFVSVPEPKNIFIKLEEALEDANANSP